MEGLVPEGMAAPRRLPRFGEGVAEVLGDVGAQVQDERPVHDHAEQARTGDERQQLARRDPLTGLAHPRDACS
ncbi:MAG: hypothetical protein AUG48_04055 [Actinobacteria bacterium 13_1_20CM_3_68_9]|nr:MAG: hypothetical protein AUG48_04055 [Actinobacteria bacterium 13_1_20CM_3_68_9]